MRMQSVLCTLSGLCFLVCLVGSQLTTTRFPLVFADLSIVEANCSSVNTTQCAACPRGTFSSNDTDACVCCGNGSCLGSGCSPCPTGYYQPVNGQWTCLACPEGFYTSTIQSVVCQSCSAGYYSNMTASPDCLECEKGFFSTHENATFCEPCLPGSFCNMSRCSRCTLCPKGEEAPVAGSTACSLCRPGTYKGAGDQFCLFCRDGDYQDKWGAEMCEVCPEFHYCPSSDVGPIVCPEDAFCPSGSTEPSYCMETFLKKKGNSCSPATLTIALLVLASALICGAAIYLITKHRESIGRKVGSLGSRTSLLDAQRSPRSQYGVTYESEPIYAGW
ncbi:uncharacterized protein RCH25_053238 [Pelodytes ibericus]